MTESFDADFGVDEWHGHNVFFRDGDKVFRTYFVNGRGDEKMGTVWSYLDITPLGRQEIWEDAPEGYPQSSPYKWWNWHDKRRRAPARPEVGQGVRWWNSRNPKAQRRGESELKKADHFVATFENRES